MIKISEEAGKTIVIILLALGVWKLGDILWWAISYIIFG